jgi:oxygen-independent coproporphyrinogen-3 oxidase
VNPLQMGDGEMWCAALEQELKLWSSLIRPTDCVRSIFFGGGTPSLMPSDGVFRLIETIKMLWPCADDLEVTLEANPTSSDKKKFQAFYQAGITRLSLGVQSLNEEDLLFLGRNHTVGEAIDALEEAQAVFSHVSADLIYALPNQDVHVWEKKLSSFLNQWPLKHLSLYALTYEPHTAFYTLYERGVLKYIQESTALDFEKVNDSVTQHHGLNRYEISNFSHPNHFCRHNLGYWNYETYIGVGPGAHSRFAYEGQWWSCSHKKSPQDWFHSIQNIEHSHTFFCQETLSKEMQLYEFLLMGLRVGVSWKRFRFTLGEQIESQCREIWEQGPLKKLQDNGFLLEFDEGLFLSTKGRWVLNGILDYLISTWEKEKK